MVNMDAHLFSNHSRGYGIEHPFNLQGTATRYFQTKFAIVHETFTGQCLQGQLLVFKAALAAFV